MLNLLIFLLVLSILVLAHELGHFLAARKAGIRVEEFGFGLPPRVWGKRIGETIYSLNALPIGGFVKLYGEELEENQRAKGSGGQRAFWAKSKKSRLGVITAGVIANFILGIIVFSIVYSVLGIPTKTNQVEIVGVSPNSPAALAGLKEKDIILKIDNEKLVSLNHFTGLVEGKKGKRVELWVERERENLLFSLTPRENPPEGEGALGVLVSDIRMIHYPFWQMPFRGAVEGFKDALGWTKLILSGLGQMLGNLITKGMVPKDVAGPIGIFQITGTVAQEGWLAVLQFLGILSVNLAVVNFLPFPALDGGRMLFVAYEAITKKRPKPEFEHKINSIGMALLLVLIALITINDISRIWGATLTSKIRSWWPF